MRSLEKVVLDIPYLFLKKIPYAWLGAIVFWGWPPIFASLLLAIVLVGLLLMAWQNRAWEAGIRRDFHSATTKPFTDHPHAARILQVRNLGLVLAGGGLLGWLLNGQIGLSGLQWGLMLAGFMLLYRDAMLFGASVTYIVTDQGVGIRCVPGHVDYRLFFRFHEIGQAVRTRPPEHIPRRWDVLAPQKHPQEGVLLFAAKRSGFSKQLQGELLLAPTDIERFLEALAGHMVLTQVASSSSD